MTQICRACLRSCNEEFTFENPYDYMYLEVAGLEVTETDGLTQHLCATCFKQLTSSYYFQQECQKSYEILTKKLTPRSCDVEPKNRDIVIDNDKKKDQMQLNSLIDYGDPLSFIEYCLDEDDESQQNTPSLVGLKNAAISDEEDEISPDYEEYNDPDVIKISCDFCNVIFSSIENLTIHLNQHIATGEWNGDKMFPCKYCDQLFHSAVLCNKHIEQNHREQMIPSASSPTSKDNEFSKIPTPNPPSITCDICQRACNSMQALAQHLAYHVKMNELKEDPSNRIFECIFCGMKFRYEMLLSKHFELVHSNETNDSLKAVNYRCVYCDATFETMGALRRHKISCANVSSILCDICEKGFLTRNALMRHFNSAHLKGSGKLELSEEMELRRKSCEFSCRFCDEKFDFNVLLERHMMVHRRKGDGENHQCPYCVKSYKWETKLNIHIQAKHLEEKRFNCEKCSKSFFYKTSLTNHQLRHEAHKLFRCKICCKDFITAAQLKLHNRRHENNFSHVCPAPECGKSFTQKCELVIHTKSRHTGEKNFACTHCDKKYLTKQHLKQHFERAHFEGTRLKTALCKLCSKKYYNRIYLRVHMRKIHGEELDGNK